MPQTDIDFEVFKELTNRRPAESVTYSDVIRDLQKLPKPTAKSIKPLAGGSKPWVVSDTTFPVGPEFMADYIGQTYASIVKDGKFELSDGSKIHDPLRCRDAYHVDQRKRLALLEVQAARCFPGCGYRKTARQGSLNQGQG